MSSGESAKPPANIEERNPFDISRRPHTEVANEIAERITAWKQARGRSSAAASSSADPSPAAAKTPSVSTPAGPQAPDSTERERAPTPDSPARHGARAPFFASFSMQRAMPPAPSPKPPRAAAPQEPARAPAEAGARENAVPRSSAAPREEPRQADAPPAAPAVRDEASGEADAGALRRAKAHDIKARWMAAHSFDESQGARDETKVPAAPAAEAPHGAPATPPREAFDDISGQREPAFGPPAEADARSAAPAARLQESEPELDTPRLASVIPPVETLDALSGRREPTFGEPAGTRHSSEPVPPAAAAPDPARARERTKPPAMQTRIEARRVEALRADPQMAPRRPFSRHSAPDPLRATAPAAMPFLAERRGTGWAIGLGAVLLLIGLTAPAAILQQGRQAMPNDPDQLAVSPAPLPEQPHQLTAEAPEPSVPEDAQPTEGEMQARGEPSLPATSDVQPPEAQATESLAPVLKPGSEGADPEQRPGPTQQATLAPPRDGGAVNDAPILAPPPPSGQGPMVNLASQEQAGPDAMSAGPSPMVARPFIPDGTPAPFLRLPAGMPAAGTPSPGAVPFEESQGTSRGASAGTPGLVPQLKPKAQVPAPAARTARNVTGASGPREFSRQPRPFMPQTLERMLETLADTLNPNGDPPNSANEPIPPSTRR